MADSSKETGKSAKAPETPAAVEVVATQATAKGATEAFKSIVGSLKEEESKKKVEKAKKGVKFFGQITKLQKKIGEIKLPPKIKAIFERLKEQTKFKNKKLEELDDTEIDELVSTASLDDKDIDLLDEVDTFSDSRIDEKPSRETQAREELAITIGLTPHTPNSDFTHDELIKIETDEFLRNKVTREYLKKVRLVELLTGQGELQGRLDSSAFDTLSVEEKAKKLRALEKTILDVDTEKVTDKRRQVMVKTIIKEDVRKKKLEEEFETVPDTDTEKKKKIKTELKQIDEFVTGHFTVTDDNGNVTGYVNPKERSRTPNDDNRYLLRRVHIISTPEADTEKSALRIENTDNEVAELWEVDDVRKALLETTDITIRTKIALSRFEAELRDSLSKQDKIGMQKRIDEMVREMFPVDMAKVVAAATQEQGSPAHTELAEYTLRREVLKRTMEGRMKRVYDRVDSFENDNDYKNKLTSKLLARESSVRAEGADKLKEKPGQQTHLFLTQNGHPILVFTDAEEYARVVAPKLKRVVDEKGTQVEMKIHDTPTPLGQKRPDDLVQYLNDVIEKDTDGKTIAPGQEEQTLHRTFQAAINLSPDDPEEGDVVVAVLMNKADKDNLTKDGSTTPVGTLSEIASGQKWQDYMRGQGFYIPNNAKTEEYGFASALSNDMILHEDYHGIEFEYQQTLIQIVKDLKEGKMSESADLKKIKAKLGDTEYQTFLKNMGERLAIRQTAGKNLEVESDKEACQDRFERGLSELSAHLLEKGVTNLTLAELSLFDPNMDNDPQVTAERKEVLKKIDADMQEVLRHINTILKKSDTDAQLILQKFFERYYPGEDLSKFVTKEELKYAGRTDIQIALSEILDSYAWDRKNGDLEGLIGILEELSGEKPTDKTNRQATYEHDTERRITGTELDRVTTNDRNMRLRDPATIVSTHTKNNLGIYPNRSFDRSAHNLAPLWGPYGLLPLGPLNFIPRYARAKMRWNMFPGTYQKGKGGKWPTWDDFWREVSFTPADLTNKAQGFLGIFTQDVLGGYLRRIGAQGRSREELQGIHTYSVDPNRDKIEVGLFGNAIKAVKLDQFVSKNTPAGWGDYMQKVFGRGPVGRGIGRFFFGTQAVEQRVDYQAAPKRKIIKGYKLIDAEAGQELAPDGEQRLVMTTEGLQPGWNYNKKDWGLHGIVPPEVVIPSMEFHTRASVDIMVGMLTKAGVDPQMLNAMIMQYLPEVNLRRREGGAAFDISEFTKALKRTDLDYEKRLSEGRKTIRAKVLDAKKKLLGADFDDGDNDEDEKIENSEIIRGHVSQELMQEMQQSVKDYKNAAFHSFSRVDSEHADVIEHVFRAMHYENAIRHLRRKYLKYDNVYGGNKLTKALQEIQDVYTQEYDTNKDKMNQKELENQAFQKAIGGKNISFDYNGKTITFDSDQIGKLFVRRHVDGTPEGFITQLDDEFHSNDAFGLGQLERWAYNAEWNLVTNTPAKEAEVVLGDGFRLHKEEVQIFIRNLFYHNFERILKQGAPPNTIYIPGHNQMYDRHIRPDSWVGAEIDPTLSNDPRFQIMGTKEVPDGKGGTKTVEGVIGIKSYSQYYWELVEKKYKLDGGKTPIGPEQEAIYKLFGIDPSKPDAYDLLKTRFHTNFLGKKVIDEATGQETGEYQPGVLDACSDEEFLRGIFAENAAIATTIRDETNRAITIKSVPGATDLIGRFFRDGAMITEVEENIERVEKQNALTSVMENFFYRSIESIPYSKARSDLFKKRAEWFAKFPRWAVLGFTAFKFLSFGAGPLGILPALTIPAAGALLPGWVYIGMIALSFYEAYYLKVKQKYWARREVKAIEFSQDIVRQVNELENKLRQFHIPETEEQEIYVGLMNTREKQFEGIAEIEDEKAAPTQNFITKALPAFMAGAYKFTREATA